MYRGQTHLEDSSPGVISLIYVHYICFALQPLHHSRALRRTIEIENIFADNTVTRTEGTGELHCVRTNGKMARSKLQNVPKIH